MRQSVLLKGVIVACYSDLKVFILHCYLFVGFSNQHGYSRLNKVCGPIVGTSNFTINSGGCWIGLDQL